MPRAIIVVPCYNEERRLDREAFGRFVADWPEIELLFVDDGSSDGTLPVLQEMASAAGPRVRVLRLDRNGGKAAAVRAGMLAAIARNPDYAGFWDADLATPLDVVLDFCRVLDQRRSLDMVFGARVKLLGRDIDRRAARHYLGRVFATTAALALGLGVYDTQCGAKLFRCTPTTRQLFDRPFISRWVFDVELLARHIRAHGSLEAVERSVFEYPLMAWKDVRGSKLTALDFLRSAIDVLRIRRAYLSGWAGAPPGAVQPSAHALPPASPGRAARPTAVR